MSSNVKTACLLLALLAGSSQNAYSVNCYHIIDRDNSSIYSSTQPPFPMAGPEWTDGQQRLHAAGWHLIWFDSEACAEHALPRSTSASQGRLDPAEPSRTPRRLARTSAAR